MTIWTLHVQDRSWSEWSEIHPTREAAIVKLREGYDYQNAEHPDDDEAFLEALRQADHKVSLTSINVPWAHPTPQTPVLTQEAFTPGGDFEIAERIAKALGYRQHAYCSSSDLWGMYCLPDHQKHRKGVIIKTAEFGFMFVQALDDLYLGKDGRGR